MKFPNFCKKSGLNIAVIVALVAAISAGQSHASTSVLSTDTVKASSGKLAPKEYQVGSMYVQEYKNPNAKGAPLILIPGLSSGAYVWDDTVTAMQADHDLYVITLAGFDGKPALPGLKFIKAKESLLELIQTQKINKPVVIGHSLGSALSIWFAQDHSNLIRGVFAVDGLPVLPRSENMTPEQRKATVDNMRGQMGNLSQAVFEQQQINYMKFMGVIDDKVAEALGKRSATSDRTAYIEYMSEMFGNDMRKDMPKISVPVGMVSPYYAKDMVAINMSEEQKTAYYASLMAGTPKLQMISINEARHFVMIDQPKIFNEKLANFVKSVE